MDPLEMNKEQNAANEELMANDKQQDLLMVEDTQQEEIAPAIELKRNYAEMLKTELLETLKKLVEQDVNAVKDDVEAIKQSFYKQLRNELDEQKKKFIEQGGQEIDFEYNKDESEHELKSLLTIYREKKAVLHKQVENEKESNLLQKQHILDQMKVLSENSDDITANITEFRALQQKWKLIGHVPAAKTNDLWKQYNLYQESFWDLVKINNELREYDFRKNLEAKTLLCEAAEKLTADENVLHAFQQLQILHEEWHNTGPVSRELRDVIWNRFKAATSEINRRQQSHFDELRAGEEDNYNAKIALCEKLEAIDFAKIDSYKAWDDAGKTILALQDEWRLIGFAPRKLNQQVYDRYRKACDAFFDAKNKFYKESKQLLNENLNIKKQLCERAEVLKDSTDWKQTGAEFIKLQKEWKQVGPVPKKLSDEVWKRFIKACDYFFEQKTKNSTDSKSVELENLGKKQALILQIEGLNVDAGNKDALVELRKLIAEFNAVGHVPFNEKDKVYNEFRKIVDQKFEKLNVDGSQRRLDSFKNNLKDMSTKGDNKLVNERQKLMRAYEHLNSEILTYENNIGFLTVNSKKGSGLIKEMERKIESLKEESKLIEKKINLIEQSMNV